MYRYLIGAIAGGLVGYFIFYKLIGCSTGSCPMTANPYVSTIIGLIMGLLLAGAITPSEKKLDSESNTEGTSITAEYLRLTAQQAKARIDSGDELIILDVRTLDEYKSGHIPNSILIPNETIGKERPELLPDLDTEILIYCRSGNRSEQAARKLINMGYTKVYDFGGIIDWPYDIVTE